MLPRRTILSTLTSSSYPAAAARRALSSSSSAAEKTHNYEPGAVEYATYGGGDPDVVSALQQLTAKRGCKLLVGVGGGNEDTVTWSAHRNHLQLDCTVLEPMFLGKHQLSVAETAQKWDDVLSARMNLLNTHARVGATTAVANPLPLGDGGKFQTELNTALAAVHKASFMSRSLQRSLLRGAAAAAAGSVSKNDNSPVTIADFAVQALVLHALSEAFPGDKFIAEEDSELLRADAGIRDGVLAALRAAAPTVPWTADSLYATVDLGNHDGPAPRTWVLDPVDGTKGFMRGEHFCIALALLVGGKPTLGVLGCPNLHLKNVLEPTLIDGSTGSNDPRALSFVGATTEFPTGDGAPHVAHSPAAGSVFFAVAGRGAHARSLAMPLGGAYEVQVSGCPSPADAAMCESAEAAHGDRGTTQRVFTSLRLRRDFVRLDGQCKHGVVGAGAAEINIRLPPAGYREKIWDHAAGEVFITEAGGTVTDLSGKPLDFAHGRLLDASVTGILSSNGVLHDEFLRSVVAAKTIEDAEVAAGKKSRPASMN